MYGSASLVAQLVKNLPAMWETWVQSLGWKDLLEKGLATHSSILAWRIPGTGEPGGLPAMGSHRVGHDWSDLAAATKTAQMVRQWSAYNAGDLGSIPGSGKISWRRKWQPTPIFLPEKSWGWRSLVGYSPWDCEEWTQLNGFTFTLTYEQSKYLSRVEEWLN